MQQEPFDITNPEESILQRGHQVILEAFAISADINDPARKLPVGQRIKLFEGLGDIHRGEPVMLYALVFNYQAALLRFSQTPYLLSAQTLGQSTGRLLHYGALSAPHALATAKTLRTQEPRLLDGWLGGMAVTLPSVHAFMATHGDDCSEASRDHGDFFFELLQRELDAVQEQAQTNSGYERIGLYWPQRPALDATR